MTEKFKYLFIILFIGCSGQIASDIYAPSLPSIAHIMGVNINTVQFSMAVYLFGMAIGQLIYGPISEGIGRKKPLMLGLIILLIGSLICMLATNIDVLILGRVIQGLGAGAMTTLWRSMFRDVFAKDEIAKYGSYMTMGVTFIIPAGPALGGYLQHYFGWRSVFLFMLVYVFIMFVVTKFYLPETSKDHHPERLKLSFLKTSLQTLFSSRLFVGLIAIVFINYGAYFSWFVVAPVVLIKHLGVSPVAFGWINLIGGIASIGLGGIINSRFVTRYGSANLLRFGFVVMFIGAFFLLFGYVFFQQNVWLIVIPVFIFFLGCSFVFTNAFAMAFIPFGQIAGITSAVYAFIQTSGGAVLGTIVAHLPTFSQLPLVIIYLLCPIILWLVFEFVQTKNTSLANQNT